MYERKSTLAQAWRVPDLGSPADEPAPRWLIAALQSERITINGSLGGLSLYESHRTLTALPGDYVVYNDDDTIEFCTATEFTQKFTLLDVSHAA